MEFNNLKSNLMKNFNANLSVATFLLLLVMCSSPTLAQKVMVVGFNYDNDDGVALLALEDIPASEQIFLTETNYDAATNTFERSDGVNNGTWQINRTGTWTKGTIIIAEEDNGSNVFQTTVSSGGPTGASLTSPYGDIISYSNEGFSVFSASSTTDPEANITEIYSFVIHSFTKSGHIDPNPNDDPDCPCSTNFIYVDLNDEFTDHAQVDPTLRPNGLTKAQ